MSIVFGLLVDEQCFGEKYCTHVEERSVDESSDSAARVLV
jgi:hypothetical protein